MEEVQYEDADVCDKTLADDVLARCFAAAQRCDLKVTLFKSEVDRVRRMIRHNKYNLGSLRAHVPHFYQIRFKVAYVTFVHHPEIMRVYDDACREDIFDLFRRYPQVCSIYQSLVSMLDPVKHHVGGRNQRALFDRVKRLGNGEMREKLEVHTSDFEWPRRYRKRFEHWLGLMFPPSLYKVTFERTVTGKSATVSRFFTFYCEEQSVVTVPVLFKSKP